MAQRLGEVIGYRPNAQRREPILPTNQPLDRYNELLRSARVPISDIQRAIDAQQKTTTPQPPPSLEDMRLSRGAQQIVNKARSLGIDPTDDLIDAAGAAAARKRSKIGKFSGGQGPLNNLAAKIREGENDNYRKKLGGR